MRVSDAVSSCTTVDPLIPRGRTAGRVSGKDTGASGNIKRGSV